jgi:hypothetical protein
MEIGKATSPDSPQALSSTGKRRRRLGGPRPQALSWVRQIVAASMCHVDRRRVQGPINKCDDLSCSKKIFSVRYSVIVNLTNGGEYGINLRLQRLLCKRLDKRRLQSCKQFCMDHDGYWYPKGYSKKSERNFFQNEVPKQNWVPGLYQPDSSRICSKVSGQIHWLQNQCWRREKVQVHQTMDQGSGERSGRSISSNAAAIVSASNPGHLWPGFFCAWKKVLVLIAHKHYHSHK